MIGKPIIVAGFGRSGTTWLSDIISKALGGLILFEPCHPSVSSSSIQWCYSDNLKPEESLLFERYLRNILDGEHLDAWLLRNHLGHDPLSFEPSFIKMLWSKCPILGYKTIRWNHLLVQQKSLLQAHLLYIIRHPLAVLASQSRRTRFWDEYGWPTHQELIATRVFHSYYIPPSLQVLARESLGDNNNLLYVKCWFWALSQCIALQQLDNLGLEPIFYESLYLTPFETARKILARLGETDIRLHPSYLFTPSMQTLKTLHGQKLTDPCDFPSFFWKSSLQPNEIRDIYAILQLVSDHQPLFEKMMSKGAYWD